LTRKNPSPYDLYCVWWDVKLYSINQAASAFSSNIVTDIEIYTVPV